MGVVTGFGAVWAVENEKRLSRLERIANTGYLFWFYIGLR
jgi:hypothetical protein